MYLIFDTETTGLPKSYNAPLTDFENWPRLVQLAWQLHSNDGSLISARNLIVKPDGFTIPFNAQKIHGISTKRAEEEGHDLKLVLEEFQKDIERTKATIGHNVEFDNNIVGCEYLRTSQPNILESQLTIDTKEESTNFVAIPGGRGGKFKWPTLTELHTKLFGVPFEDAHDAAYDVDATSKCFFGLLKKGVIQPFDDTPVSNITYEPPKLAGANFAKEDSSKKGTETSVHIKDIKGDFCHLHVHSQYSVLQATGNVKSIIKKAKELNMSAVGLTDLGNMFGGYKFVEGAIAAGIKPILGCEFYISETRLTHKFTKDSPDKMSQQVLLAKNKAGFHNLTKLTSLGYIEGLYGLYPRIDKDLILQYKENIIALTGGLKSEIPYLILNVGEQQAEEVFKWWHENFGDDFYVEINRHGLEEEDHLNEVLLSFAKKYGTKIIASNDVFYIDKNQSRAHDILLCIKDNKSINDPVGYGRAYRNALPNQEYYFKTQDEMKALFADIPEAIENIQGLVDKIETYQLKREVLLPAYDIPDEFKFEEDKNDGGKRGENNYLRYLAYEGAKKRYGDLTTEIEERLDFELVTIENTGYPGYFLIVQDFTTKAREMGVSVGPGRGSAAGSVVAYCIKITNVDPIKYDLLFERFLNPDRVSLPDIDIDFDDEGRDKVIQYVIDKYGSKQVAQIITYGTMAAKSAIKDAGRVMDLSLPDTSSIANLVPERPGTTLDKAFEEVKELRELHKSTGPRAEVLQQAKVLEGSVRNTGIHACGVIITPEDITNFIPVATAKDSSLLVTQFDNSVVEDAGMLKMDFLGLKTLSIIKTAIVNIKERHGIDIDPDQIPLDDEKTYHLYQRGETNGTFQFESPGMQKHLRALKPDRFEDLIAMNALYRPGPMEYIPNFIARKHGTEKIDYPLSGMEDNLAETYGITVYQEQVMLLSQKLAGFTKGEADSLRKGMGKKKKEIIDELKPKFVDGCAERGHDPKIVEKVWSDWEAFAAYAFNKSHSTCYSVVAYHTAYFKANYPEEYMAAVLTHNQSNIEKVSFFMEECRNRSIKVLGPHVNESGVNFKVNSEGQIRFGMGAIKGTGDSAVTALIEERNENGPFSDIFDFAIRVNLKSVNKKTFEALAMSGAFDCFGSYHRRQYLLTDNGEPSLIENAIKYATKVEHEKQSAQASLFGGDTGVSIPAPKVADVEEYTELDKLKIEKEVVGLYISGHPLDQFKFEVDKFCNTTISRLNENLEDLKNIGNIKIAGIVTEINHRMTKTGKPFGTLTVQDFTDSYTFFMFSDDYLNFKEFFTLDWGIYLQGVIQNRWKGGELEFKIRSISLLSDLREKLTKSINLQIKLEDLNESVINEIISMTNAHSGTCDLKLNIRDTESGKTAKLLSRKFKIDPADELLDKLNAMDEIEYQITS
ncbi:MAG: DNA polymerase-3 subunit alpha [Bacteroidia bacterium]|jgi:DNA polymerase-3 subunit alpha